MGRKCCICHSNENKPYKKVGDYDLLQCRNCDLVYLAQEFSGQTDFIKDASSDLQKSDKEKIEYWSFPNLFEKHKKIFLGFFDERLKRVNKYNKNIESMLDVGSGYGFWMKYCEERGIRTEGFDISKDVVDYAKNELKLNVQKEDAIHFQSSKKYDLIMMFDLVEHIEDPNKLLTKYKQFLNEDGLLYIQVPNLIGFRIPQEHGYGLPHHLWQFNLKSMKKLLDKNDYSAVGNWTGPMGVIGAYEKGKNIFLNKMMWKISSKFNLGTRLQVIAKKTNAF